MAKFGVGQPLARLEDERFLTGAGRYTDDISLPGQLYGFLLRSPHAHAVITGIDKAPALAEPGVVAVYDEADLTADGIGHLPCMVNLPRRDGLAMVKTPRPLLAAGKVRHVGDPVAFIVAETAAAARAGAEALGVDYDDLPSVSQTGGALDPDAAAVWGPIAPGVSGNLCFDWEQGDASGVEAAFARAARVVSVDLVNNRIVSNPMEARAAIGAVQEDGRLVLYTSSQGSHGLRDHFARLLGVAPETLRVVTPDVGGGFGTKIFPYPEQGLVLYAARKLGRPVKWTGERTDSFLGDAHGRDNLTTARLALDGEGRILGLAVETIANLGAYLSLFGPYVATGGTAMLTGVYDVPVAHVRVRGVFTHTTPVDAYRGAGRPEAAYVIERVIEAAGRETGLGPIEIRRRNFVPPAAMPYRTAFGKIYDSGDFARNLDDGLAMADLAGFPARRAAAAAKGLRRGLGIAYYIEVCGGAPEEAADLRVRPDGRVEIRIGSQSNGQGHHTAYAQIASGHLGVDPQLIDMLQGDTDEVATGRGTGGSRSIPVGGVAVERASLRLIEKGQRLAAHYLEAAEADIEFADGTYTIVGTDRQISLSQLAVRSAEAPVEGETPGLDGAEKFVPEAATFPNGCHVCEVEIDPATGVTRIVAYSACDDFGTILNPKMLEGQVHGGIAQGVGQALLENCVYDPDSGQLLSGSFMDYGLPRAGDFPQIRFQANVIPCTTNPLGVKGAGEAGAIGAPPAVVHAVLDALIEDGVPSIDMPITPEKLWRALQQAAA